jgi:transcriptional regulator with XRE-family HTH domain
MHVSPSVEKMIAALKQELRARGLRRRDVAAQLAVSDITVKRYLGGKGVTIATLERLAALVDLDLLSLAALAQEQSTTLPELTPAQQKALGTSQALASVFLLLIRGWTPLMIQEEFALSQQRVDALLTRLQDLGLIRRDSGRRIKILASFDADPKGGNQLSDFWRDHARQFLSELDLRSEGCEWFYNAVRLSPASAQQLRESIQHFMGDVRTLGRKDLALAPDEVNWYRVFIGAEPRKRPMLVEHGRRG